MGMALHIFLSLRLGIEHMDARGVQRLLEKTYGLADTGSAVGAKMTEGVMRDARLSDAAKRKLAPLYREETLRRTLSYAGFGLAICRAIENEMDDDAARTQLEFYRECFHAIYAAASEDLEGFADSHALEPQ